MTTELDVVLEYPTYREGIPPLVEQYLAGARPPSVTAR